VAALATVMAPGLQSCPRAPLRTVTVGLSRGAQVSAIVIVVGTIPSVRFVGGAQNGISFALDVFWRMRRSSAARICSSYANATMERCKDAWPLSSRLSRDDHGRYATSRPGPRIIATLFARLVSVAIRDLWVAAAGHTEAMLAAFDAYADQLGPGLFGHWTGDVG
jgi:hypothetical protein